MYTEAVRKAEAEGKIPGWLAGKLERTLTAHQFYHCLDRNGYLSDVWDAVVLKEDKYPWTLTR